MEAMLESIVEAALGWGPHVVAAALILLVGWTAAGVFRALARRALRRAGVDETLVRFAASTAYFATLALVVIAALGRLGLNTTSFAAVVAAAGLAIGLAFQDSLSNFASGVLLVLFRPSKAGDYVEAGGVAGAVQAVQVFTTVLNTPDNRRVIVPNSQITADAITNYSANDTRRVDLTFGIGYGDDVERAKAVIQAVLAEDSRVLSEPAAAVAVAELADSSVNLLCRPWVRTEDYWAVHADITEAIKRTFDREGLSIPFPQHDVHLVAEAGQAA